MFLLGAVPLLTIATPIPPADSPLRLLDLRWLARPAEQQPFFVDTEIKPPAAGDAGELTVLAAVNGPGVMHYFAVTHVKRLLLEVDGAVVLDDDGSNWRNTVHSAATQGQGEPPWAWPLVQRTAIGLECAVPIPFNSSLRVLSSDAGAHLYLAGSRLKASPERRFGGPKWQEELATVQDFLGIMHTRHQVAPPVESWQGVYPLAGSHAVRRDVAVQPNDRVNLLSLQGSGEIVGIRFEFHLPFFNRLRDLVIEIYLDDSKDPTLRLPLVDMLGDMQPFFRLWNLTRGTWVAGLQIPGAHEPWMTGWFRLPIPYRDGLHIELVNRHPDLPQQLRARFQVAPLTQPEEALRLCGTRHTLELPMSTGENLELLRFGDAGRLAMLTLFSTGHENVGAWTRQIQVGLNAEDGRMLAGGYGFLPLGTGPFHQKPLNLVWSQPRYQVTTWMAAHRAFWIDPQPFPAASGIHYRGGGPSGPKIAEVAALWYQVPPYAAPAVAERARSLPPLNLSALPAEEPGGWSVEAESLLPRAVASGGDIYVERELALDAQASGNALLAWNAPKFGAHLDIFVVTPPTPYVQVWVRTPGVPGGGRFAGRLVAADKVTVEPLWQGAADDFARRSRGEIDLEYRIDCFSRHPLQRLQQHYPTAYIRNPAPGDLARLRFVAASHTNTLLTADQITMNPAPPLPPGWQALYNAVATASPGVQMEPMNYGRKDFHGYGGLRLVTTGAATIRLPLATVVPAREEQILLLRGHVVRGSWTAAQTDGDSRELDPAATADWSLGPLPGTTTNPEVLIKTSTGGELLLNAWQVKLEDAQ